MLRPLAALLAGLLLATASPTLAADSPETFAALGDFRVLGDGPDGLDLGVGIFDFDNDEDAPALFAQWRSGRKFAFLGPVAGVVATADSSVYGFLGLHTDFAWKRLTLTPQTSIGAYHRGAGKDLGGVLEFRTALTLAWRFAGESRIGLQVAHTSNADLYDENPGADEIYLTFGFPF